MIILLLPLICIVCNAVDPPGAITLSDPSGTPVVNISLTAKINSGIYSFHCVVEEGSWTIHPSLPRGLSFHSQTPSFQGEPSEVMEKQTYNVTVTNSAGSSSLLFTIEIVECKEGFYIKRLISGMSGGHITISRGSTILEDVEYASYLRETLFCLPLGEISFFLNCTGSSTMCFGHLSTTNGMHYLTMHVHQGEAKTGVSLMKADEVPTLLSNTTTLMIPAKRTFSHPFTLGGVYSDVTVTPSLPSTISFDSVYGILKGSFNGAGLYRYTISTENAVGSVDLVFSIYVDRCPEGLFLAQFYGSSSQGECSMKTCNAHCCSSSQDGNTGKTSNAHCSSSQDEYSVKTHNGQLIAHDVIDSFYTHNLCLPEGEYILEMTSGRWSNPLLLLDEQGFEMERFQKTHEGVQQERFFVGTWLPRNSTFRMLMAASIDSKWTQPRFNDGDWQNRFSGHWGTFTSPSLAVYFRRVESFPHPTQYAQFILELAAQDSAVVYINGNEVHHFYGSSAVTNSAVYLPTTLLNSGSNVIGVRMTCEERRVGQAIDFDLRIRLSTSQCVQQKLEATLFDDQPQPDPQHPAGDAFSDQYSWWNATVPVNLFYSTSTSLMPAKVVISYPSQARSLMKEVVVYGQLVDRSHQVLYEDTIGVVTGNSLFVGVDTEVIELWPTRVYNTIRLHVVNSSDHTTVQANRIHFLYCQQSTCRRKIGVPETRVSHRVKKNCPWGTYGQRYMVCSRSDVTPVWTTEDAMCISKYSQKGWAFVDTRFTVEGARLATLDTLQQFVVNTVPQHLTVWAEQISIPVVIESTTENPSLDLVLRFTVEQAIGDYVETKMTGYVASFMNEMQSTLSVNVTMTMKPTLYLPFPWTLIIIVISAIVGTLLAFMLGIVVSYIYFRSGNKSEHKQLSKKKTLFHNNSEIDSLLA